MAQPQRVLVSVDHAANANEAARLIIQQLVTEPPVEEVLLEGVGEACWTTITTPHLVIRTHLVEWGRPGSTTMALASIFTAMRWADYSYDFLRQLPWGRYRITPWGGLRPLP